MAATTQGQGIAQFIRDHHREIKRLFSEVQGRQDDDRREAFEHLVRLLAVHETAEEEVIYPLVRRQSGGDEIADARFREESEAKRMLADLDKVGVDSDELAPWFAVLRDAVIRHANSEEATVLPLLERTQEDMLDRWVGRSGSPSSWLPPPHPRAPDSALGNLAVGPLATVVDRTRDAPET